MEHILEAAEGCIREDGFESLKMAEVARRAGTAVGTLYSRFTDKLALLRAIQNRVHGRVEPPFLAEMETERGRSDSLDEAVALVFTALSRHFLAEPALFSAMMMQAIFDPLLKEGGEEANLVRRQAVAAALLPHRHEVGQPDPELAIDMAYTTCLAVIRGRLLWGAATQIRGPFSDDVLVTELVRVLTAYLKGAPGTSQEPTDTENSVNAGQQDPQRATGGRMSRPTRVSILDGGSMAIDGHKIYWNRGPGGEIRFPVYTTLIEHNDGLFVFDTGFDLEHMQTYIPHDYPIQSAEQTVPAQFAKVGYKPEDVTHVITSHFHIDHTGGHKYFPNATFVCHEKEHEAARHPFLFERMSYSCLGWSGELTETRDDLPDGLRNGPQVTFEKVSGDIELFPGIWLFETFGHSAGHYSMMVELAGRRPMLFTSDACMTPRNLEEMIIGGFHLDAVAATNTLFRLKALGEEHDAELFYSHHMGSFDTWLKAPRWYV